MATCTKTPRTRQAQQHRRDADIERLIANEYSEHGAHDEAAFHRAMANHMMEEAEALTVLNHPPTIVAGEAVADEPTQKSRSIRNTLNSPDSVALEASVARTDLLLQDNLDVTALAVDAANSVDADNSLEKMLAHQLATAHALSMRLVDKASALSKGVQNDLYPQKQEAANIQTCRLINATARLMSTYQSGLLVLHKLRTGGQQTVTVQHVNVRDGGQAVIGNVTGRGSTDGD